MEKQPNSPRLRKGRFTHAYTIYFDTPLWEKLEEMVEKTKWPKAVQMREGLKKLWSDPPFST